METERLGFWCPHAGICTALPLLPQVPTPKLFSHKALSSASCHGQKSLFNIAFQLLMRLSLSRIFAFKDPSCFFRLQGNTPSVPSAHARQITAIELLPPHPEWKLSAVNIFFHTSFLYPFEISSLCQVQGHALLNILFLNLASTRWTFFRAGCSQRQNHREEDLKMQIPGPYCRRARFHRSEGGFRKPVYLTKNVSFNRVSLPGANFWWQWWKKKEIPSERNA